MYDDGSMHMSPETARGAGSTPGPGRSPRKDSSFDLQRATDLVRMARELWSQRDVQDASPERISRALTLLPELASTLEEATGEIAASQPRAASKPDRSWRFFSHEIRKRLHLANLALYRWQHLEDDERSPAEEDRLLRSMHSALEQLGRLADDLQPREGSEGAKATRLRPIREVIEELLVEAHPLAAQEGARLDAVQPIPDARVDAGPLELVLLNLIHNSLSHLDAEESDPWVQVAVEPADGSWQFLVLDNGVGIPEGLQEKVFEERVQVDGDGSGDGLGLALVRRIVEENGGRIRLESREGRGTVVRFLWPMEHD